MVEEASPPVKHEGPVGVEGRRVSNKKNAGEEEEGTWSRKSPRKKQEPNK
jgi:hypothetical protein